MADVTLLGIVVLSCFTVGFAVSILIIGRWRNRPDSRPDKQPDDRPHDQPDDRPDGRPRD